MRPRARFPSCAAAVVVAAALLAPGCLAAAVVVGGAAVFGAIKYDQNEAYRDFREPLGPTWSATVASLRENGYSVPDEPTHGPSDGEIETGDAVVVVERHPQDFTRVRVRVGTFESEDNRRRAGLILESVAKRVE